jgi:heme exporter protein D
MQPQTDPQRKARETALALGLTVVFGGGFLAFLIFISGGFFFYVLVAVGVVGMIGTLHYYLWGQSLMREVAAEREEEERRQRQEAEEDDFTRDKIRPRRF